MAQMNWIFLDDAGNRHRIGLYHGDRSGHLVIYCNLKVVQVDFAVKDSQVYSFFVEDEFCEVHVIKGKDGSFGYGFEINKEIDTPRNRERKSVNRIERRHIALFIGALVVFIGAVLIFNRYQKNRRIRAFVAENSIGGNLSADEIRQIRADGKEAVATFFVVNNNGQQRAFYTFVTADSTQISGNMALGNNAFVLPNGFELADRDEFSVRYLPEKPRTHRIDFFEPKANTLKKYFAAAVQKEQAMHPDKSPGFCQCLVETVYQQQSWQKLGIIYNQTDGTGSKQNKYHYNQYLRLVREPEMERKINEQCWDK